MYLIYKNRFAASDRIFTELDMFVPTILNLSSEVVEKDFHVPIRKLEYQLRINVYNTYAEHAFLRFVECPPQVSPTALMQRIPSESCL